MLFYSWNTATAGTGGTITSGTASDSICPRNWKLPTSNNQSKGSFYYLLSKYGLTSSVSAGSYNIARNPLYFVRSGYVYPNGPGLSIAGLRGYYWSSTPNPSSANYAYYLIFTNTNVTPSDYNYRYLGFSLRCLAR